MTTARSYGIQLVGGVHDVTINGFQLQDFYSASSANRSEGIIGLDTANDVIENNIIHGVRGVGLNQYGMVLGTNDRPGVVHDVDVKNNVVYDIGPGGEAMGIWLLMTKNMTIEQNEIYLVRKEGIRDWYGLDNTLTSNRLFLNWSGMTLESAVGDLVDNNVSYANVVGVRP